MASRLEKAMAKAMAQLQKMDVSTENVDTTATKPDTDYRPADAIAVLAHWPGGFVGRKCPECGNIFAANSKIIGFCSDPCRRENWAKTMGIPWNSVSTRRVDVWDGNPPMVISPEQFKKLQELARWVIQNENALLDMAMKWEPLEVPTPTQAPTVHQNQEKSPPELPPVKKFQPEESDPIVPQANPQPEPSSEDQPQTILGVVSFQF